MIKAPITKNGDIRYFEFIKLVVLVAFFVALVTNFTEQEKFFVSINSIYGVAVSIIFICVTLITEIYRDLKAILSIIKGVIISYIPVYYVEIKRGISTIIETISSLFISDLSQAKLCVVRC